MTTKRVLVTGGALRLGALISRHFARGGWEVWCHYHRSEQAAQRLCDDIRAAGGRAQPVQADMADESQRRQMMQSIVDESGPLRCIVNNASVFEPDSGDQLNVEVTRQQLEVNLLAPMALGSLLAQQATDAQGEHSILHILDQKVFNLNPDYFSYTLSKLALERSVELQAQALAPGIRVCGIAPGLMYLSGPQTQDNFDRASRVNLLRRATDPQQVAATCLFLAENPCITGTTLAVDNGQHLVPLPRDVMFVVEDLLKKAHDA
jgi:NAD(P)-dependent dehydrogenase (short-subunit alcohol dehydrogenase family)